MVEVRELGYYLFRECYQPNYLIQFLAVFLDMVQWRRFMDLTKSEIRKAYEPFLKIAFYNFFRNTLYVLVINIFFLFLMETRHLEGPYPWPMVIVIYLLLSIAPFWIVILSLVERKKGYFQTELFEVCTIDTDGLFGDYRNSNQEIKKFYSKEIDPERNKLVCRNKKGQRVSLRIIESKKKMKLVRKYFVFPKSDVYITYGKWTKIIFKFESIEPKDSMKYNNVKWLNNMF